MFGFFVQIISFAWVVSEILLTRIKRSGPTRAQFDKSSLVIIWATVVVVVPLGVFLGIRGIGFISFGSNVVPWIGLFLMVSGIVIRWTSIITLGRYFTTDVSILSDHTVVTKGAYRLVRHPTYAGSLLSFLGLGLTFSNWLSTLVILLPMIAVFAYRINVEERALVAYFGDAYINYRKATKRLIPGIY
jgi:protein-S-isoprenylcysteine O-methyltransferase Ste14